MAVPRMRNSRILSLLKTRMNHSMKSRATGIGIMGPHGEDRPDTCPICGLPAARWKGDQGKGYLLHGERYCCKPCAEDLGCICTGLTEEDRALDVGESGATLAPRRRSTHRR